MPKALGDKQGKEKVEPWPDSLPIPPAPARTPEEEAKTFQLPPGLKAELVAADPQIGVPVAMQWGADGRLWVVEMRGYMPNVDGTGETETKGRIVILEDTNGDGRMDKETVFLQEIVLPRAIALRKNGALIAAPPALYWCPDENGDGKADKTEVLHPTFIQGGNPEHQPNGLLLALDNWMYNAKCSERFRFNQKGEFQREATWSRGQWGIQQDDFGRLFYNYNSDQLRADFLPGQYLRRNKNYKGSDGVNVKVATSQLVFPSRVTPGVNRGYRSSTLVNGRLKEFTAASAPTVFRGTALPREYYGNAFVPEPSANLIKRNLLTEKDGGITAKDAYAEKEFMTSTDERFRPVSLYNGPDGALYVVDLYRGVIQHRVYLTPWLKSQYVDRKLDQPHDQGRIWRIVPEGFKASVMPNLLKLGKQQWIALLDHANAWHRETAQRLLVEAGDESTVAPLKAMVTGGKTPVGRIHALWTLEGLEKLDPATVNAALLDQSPKVRAHAIRLAEPFAKADRATQTALFGLEKDSAFDVQVQLMLTLGEIPGTPARELLVKLAARHSESTLGRSAFFSGIGGTELETLRLLAMSPGLSERSRGNAALLEGLATCVWEERNPDRILAALDFVANTKGLEPWKQSAVLTGLGVGASAKVKRPIVLPTEATVLARIKAVPSLTKPAAMIDSMLVWKDKPGWTPPKKAAPLTAADKQWVAAGEQTYMVTCGACHQPHGNGQEGLAPPLTNSEWVSGPSGRLIRIILQGVGGPIETNGKKFNMDMPPLGAALSDEQVAQVASFVRRSFGNEASVIRTEEVASVREKTEDRAGLWTADELLNIP